MLYPTEENPICKRPMCHHLLDTHEQLEFEGAMRPCRALDCGCAGFTKEAPFSTSVDVEVCDLLVCSHDRSEHSTHAGCMIDKCPCNGFHEPPGVVKVSKPETVDHPAHYGGDTVYEVIKVIKAWGFFNNALRFNSIKYLARAGKKGDLVEDLEKAIWYIQQEIKNIKEIELA